VVLYCKSFRKESVGHLPKVERKEDERIMETFTTPAIYEDGKLRPLKTLPCREKEQVLLKVIRQSVVQKSQGLLQGLDPKLVQEVAEGDEFSVLA
jgi:predicted DNA-binding antitoxin AbrB/MazE fold protein